MERRPGMLTLGIVSLYPSLTETQQVIRFLHGIALRVDHEQTLLYRQAATDASHVSANGWFEYEPMLSKLKLR
jgi:hypothetical protein